jgi:hypothetical protein
MISALFILACLGLGLLLNERFSLSRGDSLVRLAAAIVLGFFWGTWFVYLAAWCCGFTTGTVAVASGLLLLLDWQLWKRMGGNFRPAAFLSFDRAFWMISAVPVLVVLSFFVVEVWIGPRGDILYFGNFTDMAFHMGTVTAFLEQTAFPPLNPQFATAKLSYHFMADFLSAILCRGGIPLFYSLKVPMVLLAFSLGTLTCHLFYVVAGRRITALAAAILFFFGHIGCFNLFYGLIGYPAGTVPLSLRSWSSIEEHLAFPYFNFLNVLVDFFQPQLAFLFGFPLAALLLLVLYRRFARGEPVEAASYFVAATIALLPLFHMHSFLVLGPLMALFALCERRAGPAVMPSGTGTLLQRPAVRVGFALLAGAAVALQFAFILSQKKVEGFSGFDVANRFAQQPEIPDFLHLHRLWFWIRAGGAPFLFGLIGFFLAPTFRLRAGHGDRRANLALLAFFAVTTGYFLVINVYRFTPSWGDSNKFFLYWDLALCLYAGRLLARLWDARWRGRSLACAVLLLGAIVPFGVEWNLRYRRGPSTLFTACDQKAADWIRANTPPDSVFLTANSYTHYVTALAGRRVVNGSYTRETGYADDDIEATVRNAFRESNPALVDTIHVDYLVVGPDERNKYHISQPTLERRHQLVFEQTCGGLRYSIYRVRPISAEEIARDRAASAGRGYLWLSELDPTFVQQFGNLQYDQSFDQTPLTLNGQRYDYGLGTHAPSRLVFDLGGNYSLFQSDIGVDTPQLSGPGSVVFHVEVDGKEVYKSYVLRSGAPHETVQVDVTGAHTLALVVDDAGDGNHDDHADWAGARLIRRAP